MDDEDAQAAMIDLEGIDLDELDSEDQSFRWDRPPSREINSMTESLGEGSFHLFHSLICFSISLARYRYDLRRTLAKS
jgi:hypothetical protein